MLRLGVVHRLGVVSQRLLREPFQIPALQGPFGPSIPIGVQGHALDVEPLAPLPELRGPGNHGPSGGAAGAVCDHCGRYEVVREVGALAAFVATVLAATQFPNRPQLPSRVVVCVKFSKLAWGMA